MIEIGKSYSDEQYLNKNKILLINQLIFQEKYNDYDTTCIKRDFANREWNYLISGSN